MNFTSKKNLKIFIFVLVAVITLGVGYAAITAITLNINGTGTASAVQENFKVHFTGTPTITENMGSATISAEDDTVANLTVTGLSKKGETAKAVYTVINESNGVGAEIKLGLTNSNTEYFKITEKIDETELKAGETTLVTITVELTKTPIEDGIETTIKGTLTASPIEDESVTSGKSSEIEKPGSFVKDSWSTIKANIKSGTTDGYKVGDTKKVTIGNKEYKLRIANMTTPEECSSEGYSQTACGFVVEFVDEIGTHKMNSTNTNEGGWEVSEMRTYLNKDIYNSLPSDLREVIEDTRVISGHGSRDTNNFTTIDKLYLLSGKEVYNNAQWDTAGSTTRQLDYYKNLGVTTSNYEAAIKQNNGSNMWWWLRPADSIGSVDFLYVGNGGGLGNFIAGSSGGVAPAFRIA